MEVLLQLGANKTVFIQFFLFVISVSFLTIFVFGPYFKAYDQRAKQTKGADQVAVEAQDEAKKIELIYQTRAREINEKIKTIFDQAKGQAGESAAVILNQAKLTATSAIEGARKEIANQQTKAESRIQSLSEEVAQEIEKKLTEVVP